MILEHIKKFIFKSKYVFCILLKEKRYKYKLKYLLKKNKCSDVLVVSFSGFKSGKMPGVYNYIRTLEDLPCNKLFILDNFGYQKRGSYYLGENGDYFVRTLVIELIKKVMKELNIKTLITIGSSKGATCALMFGLELQAKAIIAGAPQYHIGNYLNADVHRELLRAVCGDCSDKSVQYLNSIMPDVINNANAEKSVIYLHYSKNEHTYNEHIFDMIKDIEQRGIVINHDIEQYENHHDVAKYFPSFLHKTVLNLINED